MENRYKSSNPKHAGRDQKESESSIEDTGINSCRESLLEGVGSIAPMELLDQVHENQTSAELSESETQLGRIAQIEAAVAAIRSLPREQRIAAMQSLLGQLSSIRGADSDFADLPIEAEVLSQISEVTLLVGELGAEISLQGPLQSKSHPGWKVKPRYNSAQVSLPEGVSIRDFDGDLVLEESLEVDIEADLESPEGDEELLYEGEPVTVIIVNGFLISMIAPEDDEDEGDDDEDADGEDEE